MQYVKGEKSAVPPYFTQAQLSGSYAASLARISWFCNVNHPGTPYLRFFCFLKADAAPHPAVCENTVQTSGSEATFHHPVPETVLQPDLFVSVRTVLSGGRINVLLFFDTFYKSLLSC